MKYPLFDNPDEYLRFRQGSFFMGFLKRKAEEHALERCLDALNDIKKVCDAPCGPGRLFYFWHKKSFDVYGVDLSDSMVTAAKNEHSRLNLNGSVHCGDVFRMKDFLNDIPDLVISVRFVYYLNRQERIEFIKTLLATSRRYVLMQYKTTETYKGWINVRRHKTKDRLYPKQFCLYSQIKEELNEAGANILQVVPISQFSDRVFISAEKRDTISLIH